MEIWSINDITKNIISESFLDNNYYPSEELYMDYIKARRKEKAKAPHYFKKKNQGSNYERTKTS